MILVVGKVHLQPGQQGPALALCQAHVERSRAEPGCLEHGVHISHEDAHTLVFVERWADWPALQAHFRVPASREFVKALAALSAGAPTMEVFEASPLPLGNPGKA